MTGKSTLKIHLRRNERLYLNGAVLRADRKVSLEFLNDVTFLLENHVMQQDDAKTPLRQLYFILQSHMIEPNTAPLARQLYEQSHEMLLKTFSNQEILDGLKDIDAAVAKQRIFDALRILRGLFPIEDAILDAGSEDDKPQPLQLDQKAGAAA